MLDLVEPKLQYLPYKDGQIAYRETASSGSALFLLHGMNGSSKSWSNSYSSLGKLFRVIAWDAPSFGASDVFGDNIQEYKNAAKALISKLNIEDFVVLGHSMGGLVAAQIAADKDLSIAGLVLSSSHLGFGRPKGEELMPRYEKRIEIFNNKNTDISFRIDRAKFNSPKGTNENVIQFLASVSADVRMESIRDGGRMSQEADNKIISSEIKVPILILSGGQDTIISTEMHSELVSAFPRAQQVVFPKAGHASYAEYPDLFNDYVREFSEKACALKQPSSKHNKEKINERKNK